jgi:hypothetical protein
VRQYIGRWLGVSIWLVPALALCGWAGVEALPVLGVRDISGVLCSPGSFALRKAQPPPQLLAKVRAGPVETVPGMPPVSDPSNLYSATASVSP